MLGPKVALINLKPEGMGPWYDLYGPLLDLLMFFFVGFGMSFLVKIILTAHE